MKFLIVIVVVVGLLWWLLARPRKTPVRSGTPAAPVPFVSCAHCGVHLPSSDALRDGAQAYCCDAHRRAGPSDPPTA